MEYWFIYLLQIFDRIDVINFICWISAAVCGFVYIMTFIMIETDEYCNNLVNIKELFKKICIFLLSIGLITSLIPTKQTLLLIGGTYLGKKAVNTVITDEKIKKIDTIINLELDKRIQELKKGGN